MACPLPGFASRNRTPATYTRGGAEARGWRNGRNERATVGHVSPGSPYARTAMLDSAVSPPPEPAASARSGEEDPSGAAEAIHAAYAGWADAFAAVTARARDRFLARDWPGAAQDAADRLTLYSAAVDATVDALRGDIAPRSEAGEHAVKRLYAARVQGRSDAELAETFFNSVVRRVLGTVGVDARTEFTADPEPEGRRTEAPCRVHPAEGVQAALFRAVLEDTRVAAALADPAADAERCARSARAQLGRDVDRVRTAEVLPDLFYREKGAYLVGRLRMADGGLRPLLVPLLHGADGVRPDAVLTDPDEVSVVFSFARSYFHVNTPHPRATVAFLQSLMPAKPLNELYSAIGQNRHGKTELFRELVHHLIDPDARFETAEGQRGLVMAVFTLPAYNVVFKVIKDVFGAPKSVTRRDVMARYRMVSRRDRVGRLVDAQEFEGLEFPRDRFADDALAELLRDAPGTVRADERLVSVRHLYTERRLRPLDVFLREADEDAAVGAVLEYGAAIRDLACANIFPGDLLMKNFGVSRHGRVIFYDYDELALLTDVNVRGMPQARHAEDETAAEPWFSVDERDVFPEEWVPFLVPPGRLREAFMDVHADLFTVRFWREMQRRQEAGEFPDFFPYPAERRLG
jgi:isocitrate dehydrogenase kinase/phosphatase